MENNQKLAKRIIAIMMVMAGFLCLGILFAKPPVGKDLDKIQIQKEIKLNSFSAKYHTGKVYLNWTIKSDSDDNLFVIEKSFDGNTYKTLAIEEASVSPPDEDLLYSVIDDGPISGTINYKLYNVSESSKELMGTINVSAPENSQSVPLVFVNINPVLLALK